MQTTAQAPAHTNDIPAEIVAAAVKWANRVKKGNYGALPHWYRAVPTRGIPVVFAERGTYKPGTKGWIIDGYGRTVFLGVEHTETVVGEFVVMIESGAQCTAQVGRDIIFAPQS